MSLRSNTHGSEPGGRVAVVIVAFRAHLSAP